MGGYKSQNSPFAIECMVLVRLVENVHIPLMGDRDLEVFFYGVTTVSQTKDSMPMWSDKAVYIDWPFSP